MTVTMPHLTIDEFLARDFPPRTQLVNGEVVMNAPLKRHDRIGFFLARRIAEWVDDTGTGEAGVAGAWTASGDNYFIPDAWWTHPDRPVSGEESLTLRYPDLVIEVRSPSTWRYDVGPKRKAYEQAGVAELWMVDLSSDTVIVNRRTKPGSSTFDLLLELGRVSRSPRPCSRASRSASTRSSTARRVSRAGWRPDRRWCARLLRRQRAGPARVPSPR